MSLRSASFTNLHLPGESTVKVAISTPPRGGKIVVTPTTGFELETQFTLSAPNWNGDGNLHYTYVAESTEGNVTTTTILGHGQKKTTLTGIILNKGNLKRTATLNPNPSPNP